MSYQYVYVSPGKREFIHRLICRETLGRPLKQKELVHHVNSIKDDNRKENFVICETGYHRLLERLMATIYQLEYFLKLTHSEAVVKAQQMLLERQ